MFGFGALKSAVLALAGSITGLAATVAEVNAHVRRRAALDGPDPAEPPALTAPAVSPGVPQDAPAAADTPPADPLPPAGRNGRRRTAAARAE